MSKLPWIKKEAATWVHKGIISQGQADQIMSLYPEESKNKLISVLLILGSILLGAGIMLFFAANWQYIPAWGKVGIIITALVAFYLASELTRSKSPQLSSALLLLGCIMFGSGIWLIAQIYHINAHFPNGLLFWFLGVLPVAFLFREPLPLALSALLLGAWVIAGHSAAPAVIIMSLLFFTTVFYLNYSLRSPFALTVSLISSVIFIATQLFLQLGRGHVPYDLLFLQPLVLLPLGLLMVNAAGHPINRQANFNYIFSTLGIIITGFSLYVMSFEYFARELTTLLNYGRGLWPLWGLYFISTLISLYLMSRPRAGLKNMLKDNYIWLLLMALIIFILLAPLGTIATMIILNVFLFIWALAIIISGYQDQNKISFTLGLLAFVLFTITQYFNLFWQTMPKSAFFMAGGIILIAGGSLLERQRRKVIRTWTEVSGQ